MSPSRILAAVRPRRVKWKIMLPFLVLTALFALFATRNVAQLVTSSLDDRLQSQLIAASQRSADEVAKREQGHLAVLRAVTNTEGVPDAAIRGNRQELERLVLPTVANAGSEYVALFDQRGQDIYGTHGLAGSAQRQAWSGGDLAPIGPLVRDILAGKEDSRGDKFVQIIPTADGPLLVTGGPIRSGEGAIVGVAMVGSDLDALLLEAKRATFADISVLGPDGTLAGTTFDSNDASAQNGFLAGVNDGTTGVSLRGTVVSREYRFLNSELILRGERLGTVSVALPIDSVTSAEQATRIRMALIFALVAVAVAVVGWMVAKHLTSPLSRLVAAALAVSSGDLSARSNVRSRDEIGVLGFSFDSMAAQLEQQHLDTIGALASAIDARDPYTAGHSVRVGDLSALLGSEMGMAKPAVHHLRVGGLLHDIGKIGIRDTILMKPGALTPEERRLIEQHPTIGLRILESAHLPRPVLEIVGGHHERLNGSGYPLGLSADELSVFPRITAVADVYDAVTTDRPYRPGLSPQEGLRILLEDAESGRLDPEVVATLKRIARVWEERRRSEIVQAQDLVSSLRDLRELGRNAA
jgi:putative nucleotidyltransferase with HDIG domain